MATGLCPTEVNLPTVPLERLAAVLDDGAAAELARVAGETSKKLEGRAVWHVSSTATGGGVAEMLHPLLAYGRGAGIDVRWMVIRGDDRFFEITKRLHHGVHGEPGSPGELGEEERAHAEEVSRANAEELYALMRAGDIAVCHDPQTTWLVPMLADAGVIVVWRSHIGTTRRNEWTERAWRFLGPVESARAFIFSRQDYVPEHLAERATVIAPSIDPLSAKNTELEGDQIRGILGHIGLMRVSDVAGPGFHRSDGTPGRVDHYADLVAAGPMPGPEVPMVVQVSRWDPLKDMAGVMRAFAQHVDGGLDSALVLAGPNVSGVTDDPEGAEVLQSCIAEWRDLPHDSRSRITLACLPMTDSEENAVMVNALQRHATVVVQKSLEEGFGLTVSEAMWKGRPVVASAVGGIQDQVVDGETGYLVEPDDAEAFGSAVLSLINDPDRAAEMGRAGREHVRDHFLGDRHLAQYARLLCDLTDSPSG
jgi:trehalose synthase